MNPKSLFVVMEVVTPLPGKLVTDRVFTVFPRNVDAEFDTRLEAERAILQYLEGLRSPSESPTLFIREIYRLVWD